MVNNSIIDNILSFLNWKQTMQNSFIVLDTETTGVSKKDQVIELSYIPLPSTIPCIKSKVEEFDSLSLFAENLKKISYVERFRPDVEIHPKAQEVHGILYRDLLKCKPVKEMEVPKVKGFLGHNIQFDHRMLGKPEVQLICTLGLAKALDKQYAIGLGTHKLDDLMSFYYKEQAEQLKSEYHSAFMDCIKTILVLIKLLEKVPAIETFDQLYNFQQTLKAVKGK
jgi:DNA polymerase III epsilon subunit-like protein